jgi:predicted transcriptional regulator
MKLSLSTTGKDIRRLRNETGITQAELGKECGLATWYISGIERGGLRPSSATLDVIIKTMDRMREERVNNDR